MPKEYCKISVKRILGFPGDEDLFGGCALWEKREWVQSLMGK
jgi:hypothetical protein